MPSQTPSSARTKALLPRVWSWCFHVGKQMVTANVHMSAAMRISLPLYKFLIAYDIQLILLQHIVFRN